MHNDKKYCDRCLWYENFCNVIDKYNGISVSTYVDISKKKNFKIFFLNIHKAPLQLNIRIKPDIITRFESCMDILGLQGWVSFLDTGTNKMVIEITGIFI